MGGEPSNRWPTGRPKPTPQFTTQPPSRQNASFHNPLPYVLRNSCPSAEVSEKTRSEQRIATGRPSTALCQTAARGELLTHTSFSSIPIANDNRRNFEFRLAQTDRKNLAPVLGGNATVLIRISRCGVPVALTGWPA